MVYPGEDRLTRGVVCCTICSYLSRRKWGISTLSSEFLHLLSCFQCLPLSELIVKPEGKAVEITIKTAS